MAMEYLAIFPYINYLWLVYFGYANIS